MSAHDSNAACRILPPSRLAKDLVRRYSLRGSARVLVAGQNPAGVVASFREGGLMAFGIFDGPAPPRDPYAQSVIEQVVPELQPAVLHQSVPFLAQSFDCVVLMDSDVYEGPLSSPEVCTATANLLACLKPGRPFVYSGPIEAAAFTRHLSVFPGRGKQVALGSSGLGGLIRKLFGRRSASSAVQFIVPDDAISRLEWHRLARQAVMASQRPSAA